MPHTPGPWKVVESTYHHPECACVQIGPDELYATSDVLPDDARLIAASPNLLFACQVALARMKHALAIREKLIGKVVGGITHDIAVVEAAIAKAEGRS